MGEGGVAGRGVGVAVDVGVGGLAVAVDVGVGGGVVAVKVAVGVLVGVGAVVEVCVGTGVAVGGTGVAVGEARVSVSRRATAATTAHPAGARTLLSSRTPT